MLALYFLVAAGLFIAMTGGPHSTGPTLFEKYKMPLMVYLISGFVVFISLLLSFSKLMSLGIRKKIVIEDEKLIVISSLTQKATYIEWKNVVSVFQTYEWKDDIDDQIWILKYKNKNKENCLCFSVEKNLTEKLECKVAAKGKLTSFFKELN